MRPHVLDRRAAPGTDGSAAPPIPTALAATERAVRDLLPAVLRQVPLGIGVIRPDRSVAYGNDAFLRIIGPPSLRPAGAPLTPLRRPGGRPFAPDDDPLDVALRDATPILRRDVCVRSADGRMTASRLSAIPTVNGPGAVTGLVVYLAPWPDASTDVLERPSLQEAFIGVLSHELRTPITSIYGGSQLLLQGHVSPDETAAVIGDIASEAERLHRLVEDILALASTEPGMPALATAPVLVQRLALDAARAEERRWPGHRVEVHAEPDLPAVRADDGYVVQILRNLISEAVRFGPDVEPVRVTISTVDHDVVTAVLDRGPGVPAAAGRDAFRLFHGHPEVAADVPGTGIGLFVARALVEALGGAIWIRDRQGGGTVVSFSLPRYDLDEEPLAERPARD